MARLKEKHIKFIKEAELVIAGNSDRVITRAQVVSVAKKLGEENPHWLLGNLKYRVERGKYLLPVVPGTETGSTTTETSSESE